MIKRSPRTGGYTTIQNDVLSDKRLSWAARGLHHYLLSKPDDWCVSVADLMKQGDLGRDAIYKRLNELATHRYAKSQRVREASGKLGRTDWIIYDTPYPEKPDTANQDMESFPRNKPYPDLPDTAEPDTAKPDTAKTTLISTDNKQILTFTKKHLREGRFNSFWKAYPKRKSKQNAWKAWLKLDPDEQLTGKIISAVLRAKTQADWRKDEGRFIPYPATWLNAHGWEDEISSDDQPKSYSSIGERDY